MPEVKIQPIDFGKSEELSKAVVGCRLNFNWFSTSRKLEKKEKSIMTASLEATDDSFAISKKLMDSKHDAVKAANECRRRIEAVWRSNTIPLAIYSGRGGPEPGTRLLKADPQIVADFDRRMTAERAELAAVAKALNEAMPAIKNMDQQRLGRAFRDSDYPDSVVLRFTWGYSSVEVPKAMELLSPEIYQRELAKMRQRMEQTTVLAISTMLEEFYAVAQNWVEMLGPVIRLFPQPAHPLYRLRDAELRGRMMPEDDDTVPAGSVRISIRHRTAAPDREQEEILTVTEEVYRGLNPMSQPSERRTFRDSTVETMQNFLDYFRRVGTMVPGASTTLDGLIRQVEDQLAQCGTTKELAGELRTSVTFRNQTQQLMKQVSGQLQQQIQTVSTQRRRLSLQEA